MGAPKNPVRRGPSITLQEMMPSPAPVASNNVIFYEVMDILVTELETKRFVKTVFIDKVLKEYVKLTRRNYHTSLTSALMISSFFIRALSTYLYQRLQSLKMW